MNYGFSDELLNHALELATEWGENFRKPINDRIRVKYPDLSDAEIDELTAIARRAESCIYSLAEEQNAERISSGDVGPMALQEFPWLRHEHIGRLQNIGMYYANR